MQSHVSKLAQTLLGAALVAGGFCLPSIAAEQHSRLHHRYAHPMRHRFDSGDITVRKSAPGERMAAGHDAFSGPAAIITAPVEMAGTVVSLPFRAVAVVFPPRANDPRMLVGAPVHFAGQVAEFPFYAFNSAFGVRSTYYGEN